MNASPLILLVEDRAILRISLREVLESQGFRVAEAAHGGEALNLIGQNRPDAVVTDMEMPVMDGMALCRHLAANAHTSDLPVLVMSGQALESMDHARRLLRGRCYALVKPFPFGVFLSVLRELLGMDPAVPQQD